MVWRPVRNLTEGGQGLIDIVVREGDDAEYVRKRLRKLDDPARRVRFENEVRAHQALDHQHVLKLIDFDLDPSSKERPYLVTEYCSGGDLGSKGVEPGARHPLDILQDFLQVCEGVEAAHRAKIIHRDLKPENVFQRSDGSLAVGDFGLALLDLPDERVTSTRMVVGSRWYCAPELMDGRLPDPTPACDVYSLGKLLYWMFKGKVFDREKHREDAWRIRGKFGPPLPVYELIDQMLDRMVVEDPAHRFADASHVAQTVRDIIRIASVGGHALGKDVQQWCSFCANGVYVSIVEPTKDAAKEAVYLRDLAAAGLPPRTTGIWRILVCQNCGHVQVFRHDWALHTFQKWNAE